MIKVLIAMPKKPIITLLTDFGLKDTYVAEMKAVILSINPNTTIVDLTHEVEPYNIRMGAYLLARSVESVSYTHLTLPTKA